MSNLRGLKLLASYLLPVALATGAVQASSYLDSNNAATADEQVAARTLAGLCGGPEDMQVDGSSAATNSHEPSVAINPCDVFNNVRAIFLNPQTPPESRYHAAKVMAVLRLDEVEDSELTLDQAYALVGTLPRDSEEQRISVTSMELRLYIATTDMDNEPVPFKLARSVYNAEQASPIQKDFATLLMVFWRLANKVGDSELTLEHARWMANSIHSRTNTTCRNEAAFLITRLQSLLSQVS